MKKAWAALSHWYLQNFLAVDQLINTLFFFGWADETLSSRAHRMQAKPQPYFWWLAHVIDALFFWQKRHCYGAYRKEMARAHVPPEMRDVD